MRQTLGRLSGYIIGFASLVAIWHVASTYIVHSVLFPQPIKVLIKAIELLKDGSLIENMVVSLRRIFIGYCCGAAIDRKSVV